MSDESKPSREAEVNAGAEAATTASDKGKQSDSNESATEQAISLVVGVGASAGGLEAFGQLLEGLPNDAGMALLLVQHLAPEQKSNAVKLLQSHSKMPVLEAQDDLELRPNHVYMIPPGKIMSVHHGRVRLSKPEVNRHNRQLPVDEFLISLADEATERAAAVILSGSGSDGSNGVKAIKEGGGVVLVEDPQHARYPGMPRSAASSGMADHILPIPQLTRKLVDFARQPHLIRLAQQKSPLGLKLKDLHHIIDVLHRRTGHDFREYKKPTLSRRIQRRMGLRNISDPSTYVQLLNQDDYEATMLFKDMLIGVTAFFRDPDAFEELSSQVLRPLVKQHGGTSPVRVWVAGCTTGEEAYSVAILLAEEFARQKLPFHAQIFATDIDEDAVARARTGHYSASIASEVPEAFLKRYFEEDASGYQVQKRVRESVTFAVQNLIGDPPFSKLDLICCRNVMIYLESSMQEKLLQLFHFALNDGAYLFLGSSESTTRRENLFSGLSKQNRIFQKVSAALRQSPTLNDHRFYTLNKHQSALLRGMQGPPSESSVSSAAEATRDALLNHYAPPAALINGDYQVQFFQGETGRYLRLPEGEPTSDICAMAPAPLKSKIRAAVQKARKSGASACAHAQLDADGKSSTIQVAVHPVRKAAATNTLFLVTFSELSSEGQAAPPAGQPIEDQEAELSSQLEYELYATRQDLQRTIEQLESSNEELKASNEEVMSMNEELQSSNEELETSREELQSLNEELSTVNNQLEDKINELEDLNNDLSNLLSSTDIATIFLDVHLRIRRFTPATQKIIRLIDSDIGRPLADLAMNFRDRELIGDARQVLESMQASEKQVRDKEGRYYLRRITLYRTATNRIEGVVLTFTDVTDINVALSQIKTRERQQALVARVGYEALQETDLGTLFDKAVQWTAEAVDVEMCKLLELRGDDLFLRAGIGWKEGLVGKAVVPTDKGSQGGYTLRSRAPIIVEDLNTENRFTGPNLLLDHQVVSGMSVIVGTLEDPWGVLGVHTREHRVFTQEDINVLQAIANGLYAAIQRHIALNEVKSQTVQLQLALRLGRMGSWCWDLAGDCAVWDEAMFNLLGLPHSEDLVPSDTLFDQVHPEDVPTVRDAFASAAKEEHSLNCEFRVLHGRNKEVRWLASYGGVLRQGPDQRRMMYGVSYDITERKQYESTLRDREQWLRLALTSAELTSSWIDLEQGSVSEYKPSDGADSDEGSRSVRLENYLREIHPEDREHLLGTWRQAMQTRSNFMVDYRLRCDEEWTWHRSWGQSVEVQGYTRLAGISMDISRERENEARLQAAKRAADVSNQAKSTFLANMSHEIRTPLTAILGYTDLLQMEFVGGKPDDYLQKIRVNGQNLLEIINDVLDLSKVEADRIEMNPQPFSLQVLLGELRALMQLRASEKRLAFTVAAEGPVPNLACSDAGRIKQVLVNLISNAIKFTREGSVQLLLSASPAKDGQSTLTFRVTDTGIGIEAALLERIFQPFEQADRSVARTYGGTGLGLTISKRITALLGGRLEVESEAGKGSVFTLHLPVDLPAGSHYREMGDLDLPVEIEEMPVVNAQLLAGVHVLVVDDIADILSLMEAMLRKAGARVSTACNGREAIEQVRACEASGETIDAVLMDTMMPVVDGFTAVKQLREMGFQQPIVALTAAAMTNDRERCLQAGCDDYISKPVRMESLLAVLADQTGRSASSLGSEVPKGARVLIIEDNRDAGEAVEMLLTLAGYHCRRAEDGSTGIALANEFEPNVILLDLTLPDMEGYAVARQLKELGENTGWQLMALSGQNLEEQAEALREAGFTAWLQKPVGGSDLARYFIALAEDC